MNSKNKACSRRRLTTSSIGLIIGIVLITSLSSMMTISNQVATAQQLLVPTVVPSPLLANINNVNNQLAALTQANSAALLTTTPFPSISSQSPLIQGSSTNGFISFLCASNSGLVAPNPSALSFQVSSSLIGINPILTTTTITPSIPLVGSFTLFSSLGVPSVAGQISTGQVSGNTFILQGTLTSISANALLRGLNSLCATSIPFNDFTITGTCGTNVPAALAIDRIVVGTYIANIACNNIA
jgi:hypothetical protein